MGLLLDLDGTLSEVVPDPGGSTVSEPIRASLLHLFSSLALVAIITGRAVNNARRIVALDELVYVGNHGLEMWDGRTAAVVPEATPYITPMTEYLAALRGKVTTPGVRFENKGGSFSVHYRSTPDPDLAYDQIMTAIEELGTDQIKLVLGKMVVNILPPLEINKGTAVEKLVEEYHLRSAMYIGDDITDLYAFRVIGRMGAGGGLRGLRIAVGGPEAPAELQAEADYQLSGVPEVGWFLDWLANKAG